MPVSQIIDSLLNGVSQQPAIRRHPSQAQEQVNGLTRYADGGPSKRPPTEHVAVLDTDPSGYEAAFVHPVNLSEDSKFFAVVVNGQIKVFNKMTGNEVTVHTPSGEAYLGTVTVDAVIDTFTDSADTILSLHAGESAGTWVSQNASPEATVQAQGARMGLISQGVSLYRLDLEMPVADYTVEADALFESNTSELAQVWARRSASDLSGYVAHFVNQTSQLAVSIRRANAAGSLTVLDTDNVAGNVAGIAQRIGIRVTGTLIEALLDGIVISSVTDATIAAAGHIGIGGNSAGAGFGSGANVYIDNLDLTSTPPGENDTYRAVTQGDITYIINKAITVEKGSIVAPARGFEALAYIRQADFGTDYAITLNGTTIRFLSVSGISPAVREEISTEAIAKRLRDLILSTSVLSDFSAILLGSTLHIFRKDGADFQIAALDGLADNGLFVIKNTIQSFADLPTKAPSGYIVEVTGDDSNTFDNYFVEFDDSDSPDNMGVWRECVKPSELVAVNASTMPHLLTYLGSFIGELVGSGPPPEPEVAPGGGTEEQETWDALTLTGRGLLAAHGDHYNAAINNANGVETEYTITYDADTQGADASNLATISLQYETGGIGNDVWVEAASQTWAPGYRLDNQKLSASFVRLPGERIRIALAYANGSGSGTPPYFWTPVPRFPSLPNQPKPISFLRHTGQTVTFPQPGHRYPSGITVTVTVDGTPFTRVVPSGGETGADIAVALRATIDADSGITATLLTAGQFLIENDDDSFPVVSAVTDFDVDTDFHHPELSLTPDALIGMTIHNDTDGSSGVVTDNTEDMISVASLTGGADNKFEKDDIARVVASGEYFLFDKGLWARRRAGNIALNPFPSFVGLTLNEVFFHRARLGLTARENVVLSEAGKPLNFFRKSVTSLLDADLIDIKPSSGSSAAFHSAVDWDKELLLFTETAQYELTGEPILSPKTVGLRMISQFANAPIRPLIMGRRLFFTRAGERFSKVYEYSKNSNTEVRDADEISRFIPSYLIGDPADLAGDITLGVMAFRTTSTVADSFFVYSSHFEGQDKLQDCWSRWELPAASNLIAFDIIDGTLALVLQRTDAVYLETIDLDEVLDA